MGQEIAGLWKANAKKPTNNQKPLTNNQTHPLVPQNQTKNPTTPVHVFVLVTLSNIKLSFSVPPFLGQKCV